MTGAPGLLGRAYACSRANGDVLKDNVSKEARRSEFVPDKIRLTKGKPVTLMLSTSDVAHSLYVRDLKINETIEPGQVQKITLVPENELVVFLTRTKARGRST